MRLRFLASIILIGTLIAPLAARARASTVNSCHDATSSCVVATELTTGHYSFNAVIPQVAFKGGRTPQIPFNPAAFVWCNNVQIAFVAPWHKVEKLSAGWYSLPEQPDGGYVLPIGSTCTVSLYYWTFSGKTPVANFVASDDNFVVS